MTTQEIELAKAAKAKYQKEYMKKWRAKNADKVRKNNMNYWLRRAQREAKCDPFTSDQKATGDLNE